MEKNLKINGKRLKECRKNKGFTQEQLLELCYIQSRTTISTAESKGTISENNLDSICGLLGVRKEYIIGSDNYKTEGDILSHFKALDSLEFDTIKSYLKTLGFSIEPMIELWHIPAPDIYKNLEILKKYLYEGELERLEKKYDFNKSYKDFWNTYFANHERTIRLTKPLDNIEEYEKLSLNSKAPYKVEDIPSDQAVLKTNTSYLIQFEIINNNTGKKRLLEVYEVQFLFKNIKSTSIALVNTFMVGTQ